MSDVGRGQPTKYQTSYPKAARKLCLLGATDQQLADFFEVHRDTIAEWKNVHPEFAREIKKGKMAADAEVAHSLYRRAKGYSHKATKFFQHEGSILDQDYIERYPPDTLACKFWLMNRHPEKWRDKVEHEHSAPKPIVLKYSLDDEGKSA